MEALRNTEEQGGVGIRLLKENLTHNFFKEAEAKDGVDYIIFSNDDYEVLFSKTSKKIIVFRAKKIKRPYGLYRPLSPDIIELADAIEVFLKERTLKNFKKVVACNYKIGFNNSPAGELFRYVDTYKKCNENLLKNIRERQKEDAERQEKVKEERKIFEDKIKQADEFIDSLTDLDVFKEAGWKIKKIFPSILEKQNDCSAVI